MSVKDFLTNAETDLTRSVAMLSASLLVAARIIREGTPDNANSVVEAAKLFETYLRTGQLKP